MQTCFVIQPFDSGKFDKRFDSIFEPAIKEAGMTPYRVDRDVAATILIQAIEENIRRASVCLADITTDNPNVWYELGFALASGRPVVMVCSDERLLNGGKLFPFDIQHRSVLIYKTESPQDFHDFKNKLTAKLAAMLGQSDIIEQMAENQTLAEVEGLSPPELTVLAVAANSAPDDTQPAPLWGIKNDAERTGLTSIGFNLGLRKLKAKGFVTVCGMHDHNNYNEYEGLLIEPKAWEWIERNEANFVLHSSPTKKHVVTSTFPDMDDDIPF